MSALKRFVLCADDYAMTPAVSRGILSLLAHQRISAAGAMTNRPSWRAAAKDFAAFADQADLGLHFNLTCGAPLTTMRQLAPHGELPKLGAILARGSAGLLAQAELEAELNAQLAAFEDEMGRAPAFVDGHQHVHAMPGVRRALATVLSTRYPGAKPYLREAADAPRAIQARAVEVNKARFVAFLTKPFGASLRALGFATNQGFAGFSRFDATRDYGADFARYLVAPGPRHLVMCHPGEVDSELEALDPVTHTRLKERDFFLSTLFHDLCAASEMTPSRFSDLP